jgi:hypothetical protein
MSLFDVNSGVLWLVELLTGLPIFYSVIRFQAIHDHGFAYMVIVYGAPNMSQHEKRHVGR